MVITVCTLGSVECLHFIELTLLNCVLIGMYFEFGDERGDTFYDDLD